MQQLVTAFILALLAGVATSARATAQELPIGRFSGSDRFDTAIRISQEFWPTGAASVVLARGDVFADALAGGPLADIAGAPILLTPGDRLDPRVLEEIDRLGAQNVYLLGGTSALSGAVETALPEALDTRRFGGDDRYETAEIIDDVISASADLPASAVVASGENHPDAIMASTLLPPRILLSRPNVFTSYDPAYSYTLVGGTSVLSEAIARQTDGVRLAGSTRYATAAEVLEAAARARGEGPLFVATGRDAPDALAAGAAVARTGGYLLIIDPARGPSVEQTAVLQSHAEDFDAVWVLGGTNAVTNAAVRGVAAAIGGSSNGDDGEGPPSDFARDDVLTTGKNTPITFDAFENDVKESGPLRLVWTDTPHDYSVGFSRMSTLDPDWPGPCYYDGCGSTEQIDVGPNKAVLRWTPEADWVGEAKQGEDHVGGLVYMATDAHGDDDIGSVYITVLAEGNELPTVALDPPATEISVPVGTAMKPIKVIGEDPDGEVTDIELSADDWVSLDNNTLTGTPPTAGSWSIHLTPIDDLLVKGRRVTITVDARE